MALVSLQFVPVASKVKQRHERTLTLDWSLSAPSPAAMLEPVKNRLIDRLPALEVLHDDSLQQRWCDLGVPDSFRIHHDDRSVAADAEAGSLAALHALRTKEQIFALEKLGEQQIELAPPAVGRAEVASAYEHVMGVRLHLRLLPVTHAAKIHTLACPSTCNAARSP